MNDLYVIKEGKKLRCGYTTGSCAAAASKACAVMLFEGNIPESIDISTPSGIMLNIQVKNQIITDKYVSCCVVKDGGDDPDSTNGIEIYVKMSKRRDNEIVIDGGIGVGRVVRKSMFGDIGNAAINPVPREMIKDEVRKITQCGVDIIIYVPEGQEVAKKTFNSGVGIEGGISIVGTTGIVEPMSDEALKKSIYLEIDMIREKNIESIILYLGNYGEKAIENLNIQGEKVKISNYIGDVVLYCYNSGFKRVTIIGHVGKLSKLSIGAFNTHNRVCDTRIEAFIYYLAFLKAPVNLISKVNDSITSEEALNIVLNAGYGEIIDSMKDGCIKRIKRYVKDENFDVDVIMYSLEHGVL